MKLLSNYKKLTDIGKSTSDIQTEITVSEVWHLVGHLSMRYKVLETTKILANFIKDPDFQLILDQGVTALQAQVDILEKTMKGYGIPFPRKPPTTSKTIANIEVLTERYAFRRIFRGIQSFIPIHATAFIQSTTPTIREQFKTFLLQEIDMYDKLIEYGKIKGFEVTPPKYKA